MPLSKLIGVCSAIAIPFLVCTNLVAQLPELADQTLDFRDVTSTRVTQTVPESLSGNEKWIEFGDYDNDGDLDAVMSVVRSDFGQRRNKLYRNDSGSLVEVSGAPVIPGFSFTDTSRSAFLRDYDQDGFLDIVIVNGSNSGTGTNDSPGKTKFFRNINGFTFTNESERLDNLTGAAENGVSADFDGNGYDDLVLCNAPNNSQDSYALNNINENGPGQFDVVTATNYPSENQYGKHAEAADMNGDGLIDLLIANSASSQSFIYYNNNLGLGNDPGDFRYKSDSGFSEFPAAGGSGERTLVPGDFNNDGLMDFYFSNRIAAGAVRIDFVMQNIGNDDLNKAIFQPVEIPVVEDSVTMKVSTGDLDEDGRLDLVVMSEFRRPQILRNTSENGVISFVDWTPSAMTTAHAGWQAASSNVTGDDRPDVFVGAMQDDFLFENVRSQLVDVNELIDDVLPDFHLLPSVAVTGEVMIGTTRSFVATDLPIGARVSVLLRSFGDLSLTVLQNGMQLANSNQTGHGSDEAIQFELTTEGDVVFEIGLDGLSFDGNGDGNVDLLDISLFVDCLSGASNNCDPFDLNDDGVINLLFVQPFVDAVSSNKSSEKFVIEFLGRNEQ